jgi:hypothetical protein
MSYENLREEEIKNKVAQHYFSDFDSTKIIGNIDFAVTVKTTRGQAELHDLQSLLWAEAKKDKADIYQSIVQLILTIGKARTFDKQLPPPFLGAFDAHQIAFVPYSAIYEIFYQNDFNWNVTPSNYKTKEFALVFEKVKSSIDANATIYTFDKDDKDLKAFIKANFMEGKNGTTKIRVDKNNFMVVYNKWLTIVKPSIDIVWEIVQKYGIIDGDFYLADLLSEDNKTLKQQLYVLLKGDTYELDRKINEMGLFSASSAKFNDAQKAHTQFWNRYDRPPLTDYWDYIVARRDLLVPQDVRERKGSFFTPQVWVERSQEYIADYLGQDWQDEYYIWDCAAGTGNLLAGLTNKYNIWASTLDKQDVDVIHDRIKNGTNLLESHVFQFDFLNGDFKTLPKGLQDIINDPKKRKKLLIYINPPYAESNGKVSTNRSDIQNTNTHRKYKSQMGKVGAELYVQFLTRIYMEIPNCKIGQFSTAKAITAGNSVIFRAHFLAKLERLFVVPADSFDNVKGKFPIGFFIWDCSNKQKFSIAKADVFNSENKLIGTKDFYACEGEEGKINDWLNLFKIEKNGEFIGVLVADAPDFQHNNAICIRNDRGIGNFKYFYIDKNNIKQAYIYLAVRHVIPATWLNDRDQFLAPNDGWKTDSEFQNDCLAFSLFDGQNRTTADEGINHWIPFTEQEVNARDKFGSNFMTRYIAGKIEADTIDDKLFLEKAAPKAKAGALVFSPAAQAVFEAGRALWQYYHALPNCNVNASLYDIRAHFQGRNAAGKMNHKSDDEQYNLLIKALRESLKPLAEQIAEKVYKYGFLKG